MMGAASGRSKFGGLPAKDISVLDYGVRVVYPILLGIYSLNIANVLLLIGNFGAALLSTAVAVAAVSMKGSAARASDRGG
jgi:hypothetical protein